MLNNNAEKIFKMKYSYKDKERWYDACWRVASYVSSVEDSNRRYEYEKKFFEIMYELAFIPGGRILANAGTSIKNLLNCFVLPIEDSRSSIYETLKNAAEIFAHGGGIGYSFSNLREEGANIDTTGGQASGPISFMSLFDQTGEVIQQASRRGAQLASLDINHPDIEKYIDFKSVPNSRNRRLLIEYKRNLRLNNLNDNGEKYFTILEKTLQDDQLSHFNISIMVTDDFMNKVLSNDEIPLISRKTNLPIYRVNAKELLNRISTRAWESGDPGILYYNRMNEDNMVYYLGDIKATNPCGEIGLLPYEACCLGSINLSKFVENKQINFQDLEYTVRLAIRFLDDVQEITYLPIDEINYWTKGLRRLGLGVFGWADMLAKLDIPYNSEDAINLANYLSWFISFFSWLESINLAIERGPFKLYDKDLVNLHVVEKVLNSKYNPNKFSMDEIREIGVRNVSVTSIAPTGSISLLAEANSGIEPFFALYYKRNITEGVGNIAKDYIIEINDLLFHKLKEAGFDEHDLENVRKLLENGGKISEYDKIPEKIKRVFITAHEILPTQHVDMQAAWQEYITNSISKTVNLPNTATVEDINNIIIYGWKRGLKGITVYRDKSKLFQILS